MFRFSLKLMTQLDLVMSHFKNKNHFDILYFYIIILLFERISDCIHNGYSKISLYMKLKYR